MTNSITAGAAVGFAAALQVGEGAQTGGNLAGVGAVALEGLFEAPEMVTREEVLERVVRALEDLSAEKMVALPGQSNTRWQEVGWRIAVAPLIDHKILPVPPLVIRCAEIEQAVKSKKMAWASELKAELVEELRDILVGKRDSLEMGDASQRRDADPHLRLRGLERILRGRGQEADLSWSAVLYRDPNTEINRSRIAAGIDQAGFQKLLAKLRSEI